MPDQAKASRPRQAERTPSTQPEGQEPAHVCTVGFCPICLAVTAVQPMRPEAVEHLINAGREFLLAMSSILGSRAAETGETDAGPELTRIDIE